jgi:hypothetical protein
MNSCSGQKAYVLCPSPKQFWIGPNCFEQGQNKFSILDMVQKVKFSKAKFEQVSTFFANRLP